MSENIPIGFKKAARSALNMQQYADNTEKKLREKLKRKGYADDETDFAVEYVKKAGLLNEKRFLDAALYSAANSKLYGRRRVITELYTKGFCRADIEALDFDEIDFTQNCLKRIRKTKSRYSDDRKMYAALLRYGFLPGEIREAMVRFKEEENE